MGLLVKRENIQQSEFMAGHYREYTDDALRNIG